MSKLAITVVLAAAASGAVLDRIAVTVGKDVITESEVNEEIRVTAFLNQEPVDFSPGARREAADRMVDQDLIRDEMRLEGVPDPKPDSIDQTLREFKQAHFQTDAAYRSSLQKYGITEQELKEHLRWQVAALRFTEQRFRPGAPVPPPPENRTTVRARVQASQKLQRADRMAKPPADNSGSIDEQLDAWLKQAREQTPIQFHKEAFE